MNLLICGRPGTGKSHLGGLIAERLIAQGYCVLVVDPEGDYQGLGRLRGAVVVDGHNGLPSPERVAAMFSQRYTSVILDLCQVAEHDRHQYLERLAAAVDRSRAICGLPHWIIDDEAHNTMHLLGPDSVAVAGRTYTGPWGSCLVTFRPDLIDSGALDRLDAVMYTGVGEPPPPEILDLLAGVSRQPVDEVALKVSTLGLGSAFLAVRPGIGTSTAFAVAGRVTEHRRHRHKYTDAALPSERGFCFRDGHDVLVGVAQNLRDLTSILAECPTDVIEHHAPGHDFSRWIDDVFSDTYLARQTAEFEDRLVAGRLGVEDARHLIVGAVSRRYGI